MNKTINELAIDLGTFRKKDKVFYKATIAEFDSKAPCFTAYGTTYNDAIENAYKKYIGA